MQELTMASTTASKKVGYKLYDILCVQEVVTHFL